VAPSLECNPFDHRSEGGSDGPGTVSVHLIYTYLDARRDLNRWLPLVKWLLATPQYIVLFFPWIAAAVVVIVAWFAILFTGWYPRGMFDFVEGVIRWSNRVTWYALTVVTDQYPPFRLSA
jgi:uncharacterized membrane protein HdeD (DUF308 family)